MKEWVAHVKGEPGSYEISVCYGKPDISWGWFGRDKMRIEGGTLEDARARAEKIAAAFNAAAFDPTSGAAPHTVECRFQHFLSYSVLRGQNDEHLRMAFYAGANVTPSIEPVSQACRICDADITTATDPGKTGT